MQQLENALTMLTDRAEDLPTDVLIARLEAQLEAESQIPATPPAVARRRRTDWLVAVGAAVAVFILIGGVVWLIGGTGSDVIDEPTPTTAPIPSTTSPDSTTGTTVAIETVGWNPVLADTRAKVPPTPATCPPSATPTTPGPSDQARPHAHWFGNLAVAFDRHTGRIVYVDTFGETWTFDVCTNTWHRPTDVVFAVSSVARDQLVYDIDSDVTIALGRGRVSVYDANTNTWSERDFPHFPYDERTSLLGAVYDPISGQVITSIQDTDRDEWDLGAYDVDTYDWALLGPVALEGDTPCCTPIDLLGYANDIDRLILTTYYEDSVATILVDPRTGEMTIQIDADTPVVNPWVGWAGFGGGYLAPVYGPADDTVYAYRQTGSGPTAEAAICRFDAESGTWPCQSTPPDVPARYNPFSAVVGDPINNRLVLISGVDWLPGITNDVWSIDLASGQWTQILAPSSE